MCNNHHRYQEMFAELPHDQGGEGRHRCAGCAYESGLKAGGSRSHWVSVDLSSLPESQAGAVRHRSPHAAWALGYLHGVTKSYGS